MKKSTVDSQLSPSVHQLAPREKLRAQGAGKDGGVLAYSREPYE